MYFRVKYWKISLTHFYIPDLVEIFNTCEYPMTMYYRGGMVVDFLLSLLHLEKINFSLLIWEGKIFNVANTFQ